jgi:hypothetical protein
LAPTRTLALTLAITLGTPAFAAQGPAKPLPDWPCDTPLSGQLEPAMLWPGATAQPEGAWQDDAEARQLVEFLTASENSPAMGEREIGDYAAKHGPVPQATALLIVSGMVERGNILRQVLLKGIKQQIIRSHVLAETVAADTARIEEAEKQGTGENVASLKEVRRQNLNSLDDAGETAGRLCHRLVYDEAKLRRLAEALRAHTQQ